MARTIFTPRHETLREFIKAKRKSAKLTQARMPRRRLNKTQSPL